MTLCQPIVYHIHVEAVLNVKVVVIFALPDYVQIEESLEDWPMQQLVPGEVRICGVHPALLLGLD